VYNLIMIFNLELHKSKDNSIEKLFRA